MNILLSILAVITTFVVESNSSVSVSGEMPTTGSASYACTYKKGQLTAGHSATLSLSGWGKCEISKITLSMRSNKSSGAGNIQMSVDGAPVWTVPTSHFHNWYGSFSTEYVPISHTFQPAVSCNDGSIEIVIASTENSIYIEQYTLEWTAAAPEPCVVTLCQDGGTIISQLVEESVGSGVLLPSMPNIASWYFVGWTDSLFATTDICPRLVPAASLYYPSSDTRLYAVYTDYLSDGERLTPRADAQSGYYSIVFPRYNLAMTGEVISEIKGTCVEDVQLGMLDSVSYKRLFSIDENMIYYIDFLSDSTAQITHLLSQTSVGYSGTQLSTSASVWRYRLLADGAIAFFVPYDETRSRLLSVDYDINYDIFKSGLSLTNHANLSKSTLLFEVDMAAFEAQWTTCPRSLDVQTVSLDDYPYNDYFFPFGSFYLHIQNGKKYLTIQ